MQRHTCFFLLASLTMHWASVDTLSSSRILNLCVSAWQPAPPGLLCKPQGHLSGAAVFTRRVITGKEVVLTIEVGPAICLLATCGFKRVPSQLCPVWALACCRDFGLAVCQTLFRLLLQTALVLYVAAKVGNWFSTLGLAYTGERRPVLQLPTYLSCTRQARSKSRSSPASFAAMW